MIQTIDAQHALTFNEFLAYEFPDEGRYELVNGIQTFSSTGQAQGRVPGVTVVDRTLWDANLSAYTAFTEPPQVAS